MPGHTRKSIEITHEYVSHAHPLVGGLHTNCSSFMLGLGFLRADLRALLPKSRLNNAITVLSQAPLALQHYSLLSDLQTSVIWAKGQRVC